MVASWDEVGSSRRGAGAEAERVFFFFFRFGEGLRSDAERFFVCRVSSIIGIESSGEAGRLLPIVVRSSGLRSSGMGPGCGAGPGPGMEPSLDQLAQRFSWQETFPVGGSNREIFFGCREGLSLDEVVMGVCVDFFVFCSLFFNKVFLSGYLWGCLELDSERAFRAEDSG